MENDLKTRVDEIYNNALRGLSIRRKYAPITAEILELLMSKKITVKDAQGILSDATELISELTYVDKVQ